MASSGVMAVDVQVAQFVQDGAGFGEEGHLLGGGEAAGFDGGGGGVLFKSLEDFVGPVDDVAGQAGQLGDVDAVAAVGAAGHDLVQKDDIVPFFGDGDVVVG